MALQCAIIMCIGLYFTVTHGKYVKEVQYNFLNDGDNNGEINRIKRSVNDNSSLNMFNGTELIQNVTTIESFTSTITPTFSTTKVISTTPPPIFVKDNHTYYEQHTYNDPSQTISKYYNKIFDDIFLNEKEKNYVKHQFLSNSHRIALQIPLKFKFLFYGHIVTKITIATGGFLYVSDFLHQYLTYTQYIAPLMANFATQDSSMSEILYYDKRDDAFFVKWSNVYIENGLKKDSKFTFEAAIFKNGTIVFVYKQIPMHLSSLDVSNHAVKVGVSDGFYVDKSIPLQDNYGRIYMTTHRTIYRYHKIDIDVNLIRSGAVVIFHPFPTCVEQTSCAACRNRTKVPHFTCAWCSKLARCSTGIDRNRQSWLEGNCEAENQVCPAIEMREFGSDAKSRVASIVILVCLLVLTLTVALISWLWYAYTHPNSKSGLCLIENRPSQLRHKLAVTLCPRRSRWNAAENYSVSVTTSHEEMA